WAAVLCRAAELTELVWDADDPRLPPAGPEETGPGRLLDEVDTTTAWICEPVLSAAWEPPHPVKPTQAIAPAPTSVDRFNHDALRRRINSVGRGRRSNNCRSSRC